MIKYFLLLLIMQNSYAFIPGYYQPGVQGIRDIEQPQKGWGIYWYNSFYDGKEANNRDGSQIEGYEFGVPIDIGLDAYTTFPYFFWMPGVKILGGSYGTSLALVLGNINVTTHYPETNETKKEKVLGLGDMSLAPFILAYEWDDFFAILNLFVGIPTGKFKSNARGNSGLGYWAFIPQIGGIYYFGKEDKNALMLNLTFEIKTKIKSSEIIPGDVFSLEAGLNHYFTQKFGLGFALYYQTQMNSDIGRPPEFPRYIPTNGAIGGELNYWIKPARWGITFKYNWEFFSKASFRGSNYVLNLYFNH